MKKYHQLQYRVVINKMYQVNKIIEENETENRWKFDEFVAKVLGDPWNKKEY